MRKKINEALILGVGHVGELIALLLALDGSISTIHLMDRRESRCKAEANDINTLLSYMGVSTTVQSWTEDSFAVTDLVVVCASAPVKLGQTRNDMLRNNLTVFDKVIPEIERGGFAGDYLVITNPVDVICYALSDRYGIRPDRILGTGTLLDSMRFNDLIYSLHNLKLTNYHCFGEHGENLVVDWCAGELAKAGLHEEDRAELKRRTIDLAYEIMRGKGNTSFGIASAALECVRFLQRGGGGSALPLSRILSGEYGIEGMAVSVPVVIGEDGCLGVDSSMPSDVADGLRDAAKKMRSLYLEVTSKSVESE